ncbi:hypothetical protein BJV78DRAFT_1359024 [Lactifluus subvellereus]|nr:hypothetical protein BJV78DRAFT_1359024 [Lactifluus subvellereus]
MALLNSKHTSSLPPRYSSPSGLPQLSIHARSYSVTEQRDPQLVMDPATYYVLRYILMSRGNDYVLVEVSSRGLNNQDPHIQGPLLHFGEELTGFVVFSPGGLRCMQRMDLALQVFESNLITPSGENRCVLLPKQINASHFEGGEYRWPFSIHPPRVTTPSANPPPASHSSLGHRSNDRNSDPEFKLVVTMHRPGLFAQNITFVLSALLSESYLPGPSGFLRVRQQICYVAPPDPSIPTCSSPIPFDHPPNLLTDPSWSPQKFPPVMVRGVMFPQRDIDVECKLFAPGSYPVSNTIPLRLTMTSENREALDLVAVPDVIDVRLFKVMGFGERGKVIQPLSLMNRTQYHRADLAAEATWELDGYPEELPTSRRHPRPRWRIGFNGNLRRKTTVGFVPSFESENLVIRYLVCLYPFRAPDFHPARDPKKPLFMGNIPLRKPLSGLRSQTMHTLSQ